jgi:DNA-binding transcriptional LysR family regulator
MTYLSKHLGFRPQIAQRVNELQNLISLVAAGFGVSLVPASIERLASQDVAYLDIAEPVPWVEVDIAWRSDNISPLLQALLAIVQEVSQSDTER